jgi:DNA repair protein RecN (Recombination protein N)
VILRRVQLADGRTRAFVNDQAVSVQVLRAIGGALVEIHGQHADRALLEPESAPRAARRLRRARSRGRRRARGLEGLALRGAQAREEAQARAQAQGRPPTAISCATRVEELSQLKPEEGEEGRSRRAPKAMMASEKIASDLPRPWTCWTGPSSPCPRSPPLAPAGAQARGAAARELVEPRHRLRRGARPASRRPVPPRSAAQRAAEFDPRELERIEERLFALRAAARKFAVPVTGLAGARGALSPPMSPRSMPARTVSWQARRPAAAGGRLRQGRRGPLRQAQGGGGRSSTRRSTPSSPPLKLERARFMTRDRHRRRPLAPTGRPVEFWVQTNPGTGPAR